MKLWGEKKKEKEKKNDSLYYVSEFLTRHPCQILKVVEVVLTKHSNLNEKSKKKKKKKKRLVDSTSSWLLTVQVNIKYFYFFSNMHFCTPFFFGSYFQFPREQLRDDLLQSPSTSNLSNRSSDNLTLISIWGSSGYFWEGQDKD